MALQNALGNLALDQSIQQLLTAVQALTAAVSEESSGQYHDRRAFPSRALQYARDANDAMRVAVSSVPTTSTITNWAAGNVYTTWYATGAPTSMDARETQREMSQQTFNDVRRARWVIT